MTVAGADEVWATSSDVAIAETVFRLLDCRAADATVCPSEVARALAPEPADWRALMPQVRAVAQALADEGRLRVTRQGRPVNATSAVGAIRLGRPLLDRDHSGGLP